MKLKVDQQADALYLSRPMRPQAVPRKSRPALLWITTTRIASLASKCSTFRSEHREPK